MEESRTGRSGSSSMLISLATLLDRAGIAHQAVRAAGAEDEIAVIEAPETELPALSGLAREVRRLGFRFVTLDLAAIPANIGGDPHPSHPSVPAGRDER